MASNYREVRSLATERGFDGARIVQNPEILAGKPVVRDTRIPVELVLAKLGVNPDLDELFLDYPRLTVDDVKACLAYAQTLVKRKGKVKRPASSPPGLPQVV